MHPRAHLLGLPREIRDIILEDYVTVNGGYVYDNESKEDARLSPATHQRLSTV